MLVPPEIMQLTKVADTESSRYALGGVRFERDEEGKAHAVATDGRRLMHVTWDEDDGAEFPLVPGVDASRVNGFETILSSADCAEAAKLPPKKSPKPILCNVLIEEPGTNGTVKYAGTDLERKRVIEARSLEGRYPRWREVFRPYRVVNKAEVSAIESLYELLRGEHTDSDILAVVECARSLVAGDDLIRGEKGLDERFKSSGCPLAAIITVDPALLAELATTADKVAVNEGSRGVDLVVPLNGNSAMYLNRKGTKAKAEGVLMPLARD